MKTYIFDCYDIKIQGFTSIKFSADIFTLNQNCDILEIYNIYDVKELRIWYNDGSNYAVYSLIDCHLYIDSINLSVNFWLSDDIRVDDGYKIGFSSIEIILQKQELLNRLKDFFAFDKMIAFEDWI